MHESVMKITALLHFPVATLILLAPGWAVRVADDPIPPPGRLSREELREKFKNATPEERARFKEIREKAAPPGSIGEELQKRRVEFQKYRESIQYLPLPEREMKLREWRDKNAPLRPLVTTMTLEEREAKKQDMIRRIEDHLKLLKARKADGTITEEETRRLQNMEIMRRRLESGGDTPFHLPAPRPSGDQPVPPSKPAEPK